MPSFHFEAVDASGAMQRGVIDAESTRAARAQLRTRGLLSLKIEVDSEAGLSLRTGIFSRALRGREQTNITRQLASLLLAGLSLAEALQVLGEQAEHAYVRKLITAIRADILGGLSLASALATHPRDFPEFYRSIVEAGEHTGKLGMVLSRLADYLEQRLALQQKIQLAFVYPGVVTLIAIGIVSFLLSYVVPQVVGAFAGAKQSLPALTEAMLALSSFVRHWGWLAGLCGVLLGGLVRKLLQYSGPRYAMDRWILGAPLLGRLVRGYDTVRFASTMALLNAAGMPILQALQAAGGTIGNRILRGTIDAAILQVREGIALSHALGASGHFPPMLVYLIRSGEATGDVTSMLERAAAGTANELERRTLFITSLLEPLLILAMGGAVLIIVLAVMLPIIDLNNLVQ